jgi:hypothetical protein
MWLIAKFVIDDGNNCRSEGRRVSGSSPKNDAHEMLGGDQTHRSTGSSSSDDESIVSLLSCHDDDDDKNKNNDNDNDDNDNDDNAYDAAPTTRRASAKIQQEAAAAMARSIDARRRYGPLDS